MSHGVRKTESGVEFSDRLLRLLTTGSVLIFSTWGALKLLVHKSDQLSASTPHAEFIDTTKAIRSDLKAIANDAKKASQTAASVSCFMAKYPAGICDDVPRSQQAGQPRRAP